MYPAGRIAPTALRQQNDASRRPVVWPLHTSVTTSVPIALKANGHKPLRALDKSRQTHFFRTNFAGQLSGALDRPGAGEPTIGTSPWTSAAAHPTVNSAFARIGIPGHHPKPLGFRGQDGMGRIFPDTRRLPATRQ